MRIIAAVSCMLLVATVSADSIHDQRVAKCRYIVRTLYPHSGFLPYVDFFISTHEEMEDEVYADGRGLAAKGFGSMWYWSLVYGAANFELRVGATAPGNCAGPMDVKHYPLITDPKQNIKWHCREMFGFYKRGVRDIDLCKHVFLPANPRDWGGGRFRKTDLRFQRCLQRGYESGALE